MNPAKLTPPGYGPVDIFDSVYVVFPPKGVLAGVHPSFPSLIFDVVIGMLCSKFAS